MMPDETPLTGCSSHACIIAKPKGMGTNSGTCFCPEWKIRQLIHKKDARNAALEAENKRLREALAVEQRLADFASDTRARREMARYLPVLERLESDATAWSFYTTGLGIATLNAYRAALSGEGRE